VHNWIDSHPHFRLALTGAREAKTLFWREQAEGLAAAAIDTIRGLMTDPAAPASVRLKAAQSILNLAIAPPPEQQCPSLLDFLPNVIAEAPPAKASEPAPVTVHNSAQSVPEPPAPQAAPRASKIGRNDPCPCGSGRKFKRCCLNGAGACAPTVLAAAA
jgi:hypothetical protein